MTSTLATTAQQGWQEWAALALVALAAAWLARRGFRTHVAGPLARWLLRRGKVGLAMRVRRQERAAGCEGCECPASSKEPAPPAGVARDTGARRRNG